MRTEPSAGPDLRPRVEKDRTEWTEIERLAGADLPLWVSIDPAIEAQDLDAAEALLGPLDRFADEHWGTRPCYRAGAGRAAADAGVDDAVWQSLGLIDPVDVALLTGDVRRTAPTFTIQRGGRIEVQPLAVRAAVASGTSLAVARLQRWHPAIADLCGALSRVLGVAATARWRFEPGPVASQATRRELHHVVLVQVRGSRRVQVLGSVDATPDDSPELDATLLAGDVLYLPPGSAYRTETAGGFTSHVEIGLSMRRHADVLAELGNAARIVAGGRRSAPGGSPLRDGPELATQLLENDRVRAVWQAMRELERVRSYPAVAVPPPWDRSDDLVQPSHVRRRPGLSCASYAAGTDCVIVLPDSELVLHSTSSSAVEAALDPGRGAFSLDGPDDPVAQALLRHGLLLPAV